MSQLNISKVYILCTSHKNAHRLLLLWNLITHRSNSLGRLLYMLSTSNCLLLKRPDEMLTIDLSWSFSCYTVFVVSLKPFPKWLSITLAFRFLVYRSFTHAQTKWPSPTPIFQYDLPAEILSFHVSVSLTSLPSSNFFSHWFITTNHNIVLLFGMSMCSGALVAIGKAVFEDDHISGSIASQLTETWKREKDRD